MAFTAEGPLNERLAHIEENADALQRQRVCGHAKLTRCWGLGANLHDNLQI
jgi:hypothetical protein